MRTHNFHRAAVTAGFVALGAGILSAYRNPATGYEMSIYTATPLAFWICSTFAVLVSLAVVLSNTDKSSLRAGGLLGGLSMTAIASLPLVRGYHYTGMEDPLSHLGTTIDLNAGLIALTDQTYPAVHTLGSVLHDATAMPIRRALLLLVVVFIVVFFAFVPLAVRRLTGDATMTYVGLFTGLLLLPLNHLSPSIYIHPTSQAVMFAPAFFFSFFVLYRRRSLRFSLLFLTLAASSILLHPQQAANLLAFSVAVGAVQIGSHVYRGYGLSRRGEWVVPEVTAYVVMFWLWARNLEVFWSSLERVSRVPFTETQAAETTVTRSFSLAAVGGSLLEVFLKLFLVSLLFALLTAGLMGYTFLRDRADARWARRNQATSDGGTPRYDVRYVFYGLLAIGAVFAIYLIGGISDQYFRHLGMLMVLASILGSIALGHVARFVSTRGTPSAGRAALGLFLVVCLLLTLPVVFPSPYVYDASVQVTEAQMDGYETTFEYQSEEIAFENVRSSADRYGHAIQGRDVPSEDYYRRSDPSVPDHFADRNLPGYYEEPTYVPVTEADRTNDPIVWNGFRFSHEDFAYLDGEPRIDRVQSNGGYDLYLVND